VKYPVYKKYASGEIEKICSDELIVLVHVRKSGSEITVVKSKGMVYACMHFQKNWEPATRDEFEKAYGEAQFELQKAMTIL
jgi:hypothetical protein